MKGEERKEFLKEYKMSLISGSILTISPSLAGILLWDRLPEKIATHFDQHNLANGWSSKPMAVFGIPFLLLLIHLFCVFFTDYDPVAGSGGVCDHLHVNLWSCSGYGH